MTSEALTVAAHRKLTFFPVAHRTLPPANIEFKYNHVSEEEVPFLEAHKMVEDLFHQLRDEAKKLVHAVDQSPMQAIFGGHADRELYAAFLQETWHYVRHSSATLRLSGERMHKLGQHGPLADLLIEKSKEEGGHDLWALSDLAALGVPEQAVRATSPSPAVAAYNAWTMYTASSRFPVAFLGVAYVLENLAVERAAVGADAMRKTGSIANIAAAVKFLAGHGEADVGHVAELENVLRHVTDPADLDAILGSAVAARLMYAGMAANLGDVADQFRHAA
jgi:pyrroloquinoline quinone (PQQ) biosynthesis protein C